MKHIFVTVPGLGCKYTSTDGDDVAAIVDLYSLFIEKPADVYVLNNGRILGHDTCLQNDQTYHIIPRLLGGKGGFGSMLRALGAQIEKTTNREACRDLSGRRMRDVKNEQKLRDWVAKASEREQEKEQRRKERLERRKAQPKHIFDDSVYHDQKAQVTEQLEDALQQGLKGGASSSHVSSAGSSRKRASEEPGPSSGKRSRANTEWLGVELDSSDESDSEPQPSSSMLPPALGADSGAGSGASSTSDDQLSHSDSGVDSVQDDSKKGASPMDVDSDDSARGAMMASEQGQSGVAIKSGLLAALSEHPPLDLAPPPPAVVDPAAVDLMQYNNAELEQLGMENLKAILMARGLKCGGTLQERAARLWAVRGLADHEIDPGLRAKPSKGKGKRKM